MLHPFLQLSSARRLLYLALIFLSASPLVLASVRQPPQHNMVMSSVDPDKDMSELNHHIAGGFLLAIGLCIIVSERYQSMVWLRWLAPILFIAVGLFLAAWSDSEIWPRGDLSWSWLIHHDAEARQHKLYALLLVALGLVECIQASRKHRRPWLNVVFPVLGVVGGVSLLFHHHSGEIVVSAAAAPSSLIQQIQSTAVQSANHMHDQGSAGHADSSSAERSPIHDAAGTAPGQPHQHHLTGPEARVQREHAWFAVVGFCVVLLKILSDSGKLRARMGRYLWANSVILLGLSLLFYTE